MRRFPGLLTVPHGRKYITSVVKRGDSSTGGAVLNAAEKGKYYLSAIVDCLKLCEALALKSLLRLGGLLET